LKVGTDSMNNKVKVISILNPLSSDRSEHWVDRKSFKEIRAELVPNHYRDMYISFYDNDKRVTDLSSVPTSDRVILKVLPAGEDATQSQQISAGMIAAGALVVVVGVILWPVGATLLAGIAISGGVGIIASGVGLLLAEGQLSVEEDDRKDREGSKTVRSSRNKVKKSGGTPVLLGQHLMVPPFAAQPYTYSSFDPGSGFIRPYFHGAYVLGDKAINSIESTLKLGDALVSTLKAEDTYSVIYSIEDDGTVPSWFDRVSQLNVNLHLPREAEGEVFEPVRITPTNTDKVSVEIAFPVGLYTVTKAKDGDVTYSNASVAVKVYYRSVGTTTWKLGTTSTLTGQSEEYTARFNLTVNFDNDLPSSADYNAQRQYEIKVVRQTADERSTSDKVTIVDKSYWTTLNSYTGVWPEAGGTPNTDFIDASVRSQLAILYVKVRANDEFSGTLDRVNMVGRLSCRKYNGGGSGAAFWSAGYTKNPASAFLYMLTNDYVSPRTVSDDMIDWTSLEEWYTFCDTFELGVDDGYEFNAYIISDIKRREVLSSICEAGRAFWVFSDGKYRVVIDKERTNVVQLFTPRNSWGFSASKNFADPPTVINSKFINADNGYTEETRKVYYNNVVDTSNQIELSTFGVTKETQVWSLSQYKHKVFRLRPQSFTFSADIEAIVCTLGDRIQLQQDTALLGLGSGRVIDVKTSGASTTGFFTDEFLTFEVGKTYAVRIRLADGSFLTKTLANPATTVTVETDDLTFTAPIGDLTSVTGQELFAFGESGSETLDLIVLQIEQGEDFTCTITAVDYSSDIFDDSLSPDAYTPKISLPASINGETITNGVYDPESEIRALQDINATLTAGAQSVELSRPDSFTVSDYLVWKSIFVDDTNCYYLDNDTFGIYQKTVDRLQLGTVLYDNPVGDMCLMDDGGVVFTRLNKGSSLYYYADLSGSYFKISDVLTRATDKLDDDEILFVSNDDFYLYRVAIDATTGPTLLIDKTITEFCVYDTDNIIYSSPENDNFLYLYNITADTHTQITSVPARAVKNSYAGEIIYLNQDDLKLYKKTYNTLDNGTLQFSTKVLDFDVKDESFIVYSSMDDDYNLHTYDLDTTTDAAITTDVIAGKCRFIGDDSIVYINLGDSNRLYIKELDDLLAGYVLIDEFVGYVSAFDTDILVYSSIDVAGYLYSFTSSRLVAPTQIGNDLAYSPRKYNSTDILYINGSDGNKVYQSSIEDISDGTVLINKAVSAFAIISDDLVAYSDVENDNVLYLYTISLNSHTPLTTNRVLAVEYDASQDKLFYVDADNFLLYRKNYTDDSNGNRAFPFIANFTMSTAGDILYTSVLDGKLYYAPKNRTKYEKVIYIPAREFDYVFTADITAGSSTLTNIDPGVISVLKINDELSGKDIPSGTIVLYVDDVNNEIDVSYEFEATTEAATIYVSTNELLLDENSIVPGAIVETKIRDDAISTPKLQANCISADKINTNEIFTMNLQSTNYVAGEAGFNIDKDGDAEFNSVDIRDSIFSGVVSSAGILSFAFNEVSVSWEAGDLMNVSKMDTLFNAIVSSDVMLFQERVRVTGTVDGVPISYIRVSYTPESIYKYTIRYYIDGFPGTLYGTEQSWQSNFTYDVSIENAGGYTFLNQLVATEMSTPKIALDAVGGEGQQYTGDITGGHTFSYMQRTLSPNIDERDVIISNQLYPSPSITIASTSLRDKLKAKYTDENLPTGMLRLSGTLKYNSVLYFPQLAIGINSTQVELVATDYSNAALVVISVTTGTPSASLSYALFT
jgi:hypothetical protein